MLTDRVDQADAQLGVTVEFSVGERQLLQQREVGGIAFLGSVESDQQNMAAALGENAGLVGHVASIGWCEFVQFWPDEGPAWPAHGHNSCNSSGRPASCPE